MPSWVPESTMVLSVLLVLCSAVQSTVSQSGRDDAERFWSVDLVGVLRLVVMTAR